MSQNTAEVDMNIFSGANGLGAKLVGFVDDHINPIVVKELRQAVRSRFIVILINLLLLVQLIIIAGFLLGSTGTNFTMGREVFSTLHFLLLISAVMFVPAYVGVRFAAERSAQNVDLMFTTTISPLSIIWGKFLSGAIIAGLLFSTAAPFMVLTYLLRGIDVPTILIIVTLDFLTVLAALQFVILLMSGSTSMPARGGMLVICLILFPVMIASTGGMTIGLVYSGMFGGSWLTSPEFWLYGFFFLLLNVAYHLGMMLASAAVVSPPSANRAFRVRLFLLTVWVLSGLICHGLAGFTGDNDWSLTWGMVSAMVGCVVLLVATCERDRWGQRVQVTIPMGRMKRRLAFLFFSGSAGGVVFSLIIISISLLIPAMVSMSHSNDVLYMFQFCLYLLAYSMTSVFIVRYLCGGLVKHEGTAAIALLLMAVGCLGPALLAFFIDPNGRWDRGILWRVGNPFGAMGSGRDIPIFLIISGVWAGVAMALCLPWMVGQYRAFRRPTLPPLSPVAAKGILEQTLEAHDHSPPLLDEPEVKADI